MLANIRNFVSGKKFVLCVLHMADGRRFEVPTRSDIAMGLRVVIAVVNGDDFEVLPVPQIASVAALFE